MTPGFGAPDDAGNASTALSSHWFASKPWGKRGAVRVGHLLPGIHEANRAMEACQLWALSVNGPDHHAEERRRG